MKIIRRLPWFILALLSLLPAVGLAQGKFLNVGNGAEPQDLDPQTITGVPEHHLMIALNEGLVGQAPDGNHVEPGIAERWEISEDGRVYTFHLRTNAKWSNGEPITAEDFVRSYKRILTATLAADYAYMLFLVAGAEDYLKGKITDFGETGFKALDAHTLQITLKKRTPFFLSALTHYSWFPVHIPTIEKHGGLTRKGSPWTRVENIVTSGPFRLKEWRPNQIIVVERNPLHWDAQAVKLDGINFYPIELTDTEERMFRAGQLDITNEIPPAKIAVYQKRAPELIKIDPYCGIYFYRFNVTKKPLDDKRVRRALALGINRELLVKMVSRAGQQPAYSIVPPGVADYQPKYRLEGTLEDAKRLLAEAGYPGGKGFPRVELLYNTLETHRALAEAIQQMWKQNLGVEIGLVNQEWKVYLDAQKLSNFTIQRAGWIADYVDPHVFLDLWETGNRNNNTLWGNPKYDALLEQSLDAKTDAERYAIYQEMEGILIDELPVLPIYFYTRPRLQSTRLLNYRTTFLDNYPWKYVDLKQ
ncbi:peptide ABC transporter substrate-binding protein [Nibricoccus sp. IMCC34717]|uniref:peptide ABC transporter substrate-binding protein n=1 Tax=Nibricoccus sp. IMCC34717 TaxID=3034021 RepID=UPI00384C4603